MCDMKRIKADGIDVKDVWEAYNVICDIMDKNDFNFNTAWEHVRSVMARLIVENANRIE